MAMVCKKYTKASFVISTGTNLESLRFRANIAQKLGVPISQVNGWVGGEHGDAAVPLWSMTKVDGLQIDDYVKSKKVVFSKDQVASYVKEVSRFIIENIGGTEFGPAASFRDIVRAITCNTGQILPISAPHKISGISELPFVGVPFKLGSTLGVSLYNNLSIIEQKGIDEAAKAIYQTFMTAIQTLE